MRKKARAWRTQAKAAGAVTLLALPPIVYLLVRAGQVGGGHFGGSAVGMALGLFALLGLGLYLGLSSLAVLFFGRSTRRVLVIHGALLGGALVIAFFQV